MPQMNKGGKFIFGESEIHSDGRVQLPPPQAVDEYHIAFTMDAKGPLLEKAAHEVDEC